MLIALDTNFLIYAVKYKIDIPEELARICDFNYRIIVPTPVIDELKRIAKQGKQKEREAAMLALLVSRDFLTWRIHARNADEALLRLATEEEKKSGLCLATLDRELKNRFKKFKKGKIVTIRQKKYLDFV